MTMPMPMPDPDPDPDLAVDAEREKAEREAAEALAFEAAYQAKKAALNTAPNITSQVALADFVANAPKKALHY